jgi:glycosyltransferase involved in cell wall biosynthesis
VDVLLKAFAQACRGQAVRLRIAGEGSERAKLERLRDQLQLSDQVQFIGRLTRPEARDLIQGSHAVVSSSYVETFGVTLIEAFACGRPVVATRSGGPTFLVNAHNGILTTPGDVNGLAAALQSMIADYQRFDPAAIRAACADQYGAAAVVRRLEAVYEQVRGNEA